MAVVAEQRDYPLPEVLEVMKPKALDPRKPSQAQRLDKMFKSPQYIAEEKIDGCHYLNIDGRFFSTRISERTGQPVEKTDSLPHLVQAIISLGMPELILDGEICRPGWRSSDVVSILGCTPSEAVRRQKDGEWLVYKVFDVLRDPRGNWLLDQPWSVRRECLESLESLFKLTGEPLEVITVVRSRKEQFLELVLNSGGEGIVLKNVQSPYIPGKRLPEIWTKIKVEIEDDVVILDFEPPTRIYTGKDLESWPYWENGDPVTKYHYNNWIGAIVFGKYQDGQLIRLGSTSGMDEELREQFSMDPESFINRVIKITAMERTADGFYRHPRFIALHPDKNAKECTID